LTAIRENVTSQDTKLTDAADKFIEVLISAMGASLREESMPVERQVFFGVEHKYRTFCFLNIEIWESFLRLFRFLRHSYKFL
jgi:hypothetical protein